MGNFDAQKFRRTLTPVEAMEQLIRHQKTDRIKEKWPNQSQPVEGSQLRIFRMVEVKLSCGGFGAIS
jgi:hypothetical protein